MTPEEGDFQRRLTALTEQAASHRRHRRFMELLVIFLYVMLLGAICLSLLVGCGGGDPEPDVPTPHACCATGACR